MQRTLTLLRPATAGLILLLASTAIAACGGSSGSGHGSLSAKSAKLKFASCMRARGVPDYPDSGDVKYTKAGTLSVDGHPLAESTQVFDKTIGKCQKYEFSNQPRYTPAQLAKVQAGALAMSKCMRAHGLSGYPDLKVGPGPGGHGFEIGLPKFSHVDTASPQFKKDNIICSRLLNRAVPGKKG